MKIFVFGNPDLEIDSLSLKILPELQKKFPQFSFEVKDPNEEWEIDFAGDHSHEHSHSHSHEHDHEHLHEHSHGHPHTHSHHAESLLIIDTVIGIKEVTVFNDLSKFKPAPNVSMHDFDAYANLRYLQKLGKLGEVKIIGVPVEISEQEAFEKVCATISEIVI